eukprot:05755_6
MQARLSLRGFWTTPRSSARFVYRRTRQRWRRQLSTVSSMLPVALSSSSMPTSTRRSITFTSCLTPVERASKTAFRFS